jgi:hypothetical protein
VGGPQFGNFHRFEFQTAHSNVVARLDRAIQYSRDVRIYPRRPGVLDAPLEAGHDNRQTHTFAFSRRKAPELCKKLHPPFRGRREYRAPGAPAAACAKVEVESTRVSQVTPKTPGIPRTMVLRLISCSPRRSGSFATVASRTCPRNLTPASRRQDHTTSPSASGALVRSTLRVHRIPPHVRDDRETPLQRGGMAANISMICSFGKTEYF